MFSEPALAVSVGSNGRGEVTVDLVGEGLSLCLFVGGCLSDESCRVGLGVGGNVVQGALGNAGNTDASEVGLDDDQAVGDRLDVRLCARRQGAENKVGVSVGDDILVVVDISCGRLDSVVEVTGGAIDGESREVVGAILALELAVKRSGLGGKHKGNQSECGVSGLAWTLGKW